VNLSSLGSISPVLANGWQRDTDTWIYGSSSYFYIAGKNVTARFPRGTKISIIQGGTVKYWYVNYSEFSYGNTSVVLALTPDFTLENAAITSPRYSYASNPQGFPACFTHSDSWDGFSTDPSGGCCNYSVEGGMVTLNVYRAVDGTADANNCTINLPLESRDAANYVAFSFGYTVKEATLALGFAYVTQKSYGATLIHAPGAAATDWNTSGNKNWVGQIRYHL
jgi:hypothetical protein